MTFFQQLHSIFFPEKNLASYFFKSFLDQYDNHPFILCVFAFILTPPIKKKKKYRHYPGKIN